MKSLIYKEFRMVLKPYMFIFVLMPLLLLIPSYPYFVGLAFMIQGIFLYFNETRTNNDILFTSLLPISRNRIVLIKHIGVIILELSTLIFAVPCALLSSFVINTNGNVAGLDANMTLFGCVLFEYALFNLIFLPNYFKTTQKIGKLLLCGLIVFVILQVVVEILVAGVSQLNYIFDGTATETAVYRAIVLVIGLVAFVASGFASYKLSCKNFEKVGL